MAVTTELSVSDTHEPRATIGLLPFGATTPDPPLLPYPADHPLHAPLADLDEILEWRCASL